MSPAEQVVWLFVLAIPISSVAWTITHEEVFREPREYCERCSRDCRNLLQRKFFYLFTCEYCFSHYVTIVFLIITKFHLLYPDWRGYLIAGFSLVWIANIYMSIYVLMRTDLKKNKIEIQEKEKELKSQEDNSH